MSAVLFVTNGHGEAAIAARIAADVRAASSLRTEHLGLVGERMGGGDFPDVGPQRAMPSGGLVAMGNVRAFARDLRAGFLRLAAAQVTYLRGARGRYAAVVAVGDTYACALARLAGPRLLFVGTAKSVYVARYGPGERRVLRGARRVFVRDAATAADLAAHGLRAEAPGNVIVDLLTDPAPGPPWSAATRVALLPGSRERAYGDAEQLVAVVHALRARGIELAAAGSLAPTLDAARLAPIFAAGDVLPWPGPLGPLVRDATLVIGQSGTANEAAAAHGVPVVALDLAGAGPSGGWYRSRQAGLLGDALLVVPPEPARAAAAIADLLTDPARRAAMSAAGRQRMGGPGGAAAIAQAVIAAAAA
jgi:hypothetical protein